jgi:hypothetical protein
MSLLRFQLSAKTLAFKPKQTVSVLINPAQTGFVDYFGKQNFTMGGLVFCSHGNSCPAKVAAVQITIENKPL